MAQVRRRCISNEKIRACAPKYVLALRKSHQLTGTATRRSVILSTPLSIVALWF
jgi:hypothetical protein